MLKEDLFSLAESRRERDAGMAQAASNASAAQWLTKARHYALFIATHQGEVSVDDVLKVCPRPHNVHPGATGSLFRVKEFRLVGYKSSSKVSAHARRVGVYELNSD